MPEADACCLGYAKNSASCRRIMIILFLSTVKKSEGKQNIVILFFQFLALEGWKISKRTLLHTSRQKFLRPVLWGEAQARFLHKYQPIPSLQLLLFKKFCCSLYDSLRERKSKILTCFQSEKE